MYLHFFLTLDNITTLPFPNLSDNSLPISLTRAPCPSTSMRVSPGNFSFIFSPLFKSFALKYYENMNNF